MNIAILTNIIVYGIISVKSISFCFISLIMRLTDITIRINMNNIKPMDNIWIIPLNEKRLVVVSIEIPHSNCRYHIIRLPMLCQNSYIPVNTIELSLDWKTNI